ncbi:MAG: hypothetical protein ACRCR2_07830 [Fusobacteriaceae bacterium]
MGYRDISLMGERILNGEMEEYSLSTSEKNRKTYRIDGEYVKVLNFPLYHRNNLRSLIMGENLIIHSLKRALSRLDKLEIKHYEITGFSTFVRGGISYGIYSGKEVRGKVYASVEKKEIEQYIKAYTYYMRMLGAGVIDYDITLANFIENEVGDIVLIDFDDLSVHEKRDYRFFKAVEIGIRRFEEFCLAYGYNWEQYRDRVLSIAQEELGIEKKDIWKKVSLIQKWRKNIRRLRGKKG